MAKVFLEAGDDYKVVNDGTTVYGVAGDDTDSVVIESGATGVTVNANVDRIDFAGSIADFTFKAGFGANMMVYAADGTTLLATIPLQEDADGTQLVFSDGAIDSIFDGTSINTGGVALTGSAAAITPAAADIDDTTTTEADLDPGVTTPAFSVSTADVSEGETATFTVTLSAAQGVETTVDYALTLEGTTAAADHGDITVDGVVDNTGSGTLTFAPGESSKTITVPVNIDALSPEDGEGITVALSNPTGADAELDTAAATADIVDVPVTFELTAEADSVLEATTLTYTVTASTAVAEDTEVSFVIGVNSEAADAGTNDANLDDFDQGSFNTQTATIAAGETTVTFTVTPEQDGFTELEEDFTATVSIDGEDDLVLTTTILDGGDADTTEVLTTNQDDVQLGDGDDTIIGLVDGADDTLSLGDVINGGDGDDIFNLTTDQADIDLALATISNVESFDVNFEATAAGNLTLDLNENEFDHAIVDGASGADASTNTFTLTGIGTSTMLKLEDFSQLATTVTFDEVTGASDSVSIELAGTTNDLASDDEGTLVVANVETVNLTFSTDDNDLDILTFDSAETVDITVEDGGETEIEAAAGTDLADVDVLNITANDDFTLGGVLGLADDAAITVDGSGDVDLNTLDDNGAGNGVTLDASGLTGDLTVTGDTNTVSIDGGSGDDTVTTGAITTEVDLGGGDDTFDTNSLDFGGATAVDADGGAGTNTIIIDNGANLDDAAAAHFLNFQTLDVIGGQGTYDQDILDFSTVNASGDLGADVLIDDITDETLNITNSVNNVHALSYELKDDTGTSDTLTVNIEGIFNDNGTPDDTTDDANDVTVAELLFSGIETVTLNSGDNDDHTNGANNTVTLLDTDADKVVVTGDHALEITAFEENVDAAATGTANTTIDFLDASGSAGLIMGDFLSALNVSILGSESDDTLLVGNDQDGVNDTSTGSTINAGQGGDIITIDNTVAGTGTTAADTLIVNAGDSMIGFTDTDESSAYTAAGDRETFDIITGFQSNEDTIDLGSFGFTGEEASAIAGPALTETEALELVDGTETSIDDFFIDTGVQRGVAVVSTTLGDIGGGDANDTLVFIDSNGDGDLNVADDDMILLSGTAALSLADFGF